MKRITPAMLVVLACMFLLVSCSEQPVQHDPPELEPLAPNSSRYLIVYKNRVPRNVEAQIQEASGQVARVLPEVGLAVATSSSPDFVEQMSRNAGVSTVSLALATTVPAVERYQVELAGPTSADDLFHAGLLWNIERVLAPEAWDAGHTGSHDTVVAIMDTGIASNHPDLAPNLVYNDCFVSTGSYSTSACMPYPSLAPEISWHGTYVAGIAAAAFDGGRAVGVAPDIGLANYNVFEEIEDCGLCSYSDARWAAMIDAAHRGFDVINMSLGSFRQFGGPGSNELAAHAVMEKRVADYVTRQGVVLVASAGNGATNVNGAIVHLPSDVPGMLNVAATGIRPLPRYQEGVSHDVLAVYSNYGAAVDVAAPGGDCGPDDDCDTSWEYLVLSADVYPVNPVCAAAEACPIGYFWAGGTSAAAPHVAAVAALAKDANPHMNPRQIAALVQRSSERIGSRQLFGHGMVNAYDATK